MWTISDLRVKGLHSKSQVDMPTGTLEQQFLQSLREKKVTKFLKKIELQWIKSNNFHIQSLHICGFYNASEWRTAWDLEKSLLWLHPQPFYFCFKKDMQNSQRSRLLAGILSRFCQIISPNPTEMYSSHKHHVLPGTVSNSIPYVPKTTTSQSRPHTREDSGPAFSTAFAHLTISWSCLRKLVICNMLKH